MRALSVFGFGLPLVIGIMLYGLFDPSLAGEYNFELRLPTWAGKHWDLPTLWV
jgi:hypothetical protein